jgi:RNA polymerase sigma factor (sigma-70 family)
MTLRGANPAEIEALYRERFSVFLLSATALVGDSETGLEVVQDAFALALRRRRSFRGEGTLEAWLWRIVLNVARDRRRTSRRDLPPVQLAPATEEAGNSHEELKASLLALPERQRIAVFLRYYADLSYAEIAAVLGVRPGTVAASLNAAHGALRHQLEEIPR